MTDAPAHPPTYPKVSLLAAALAGRCPRCGRGRLFDGLLGIAARCAECGLDFSAEDAGDGPAVLVILLLGAIIVGLAVAVEIAFAPPIWVHIVLFVPLTFAGAVALLRPFKAGLIVLQYRYRGLGEERSQEGRS